MIVSNLGKDESRLRNFGNTKAEMKALAILAWKGGMPIAEIARELGVSRPTVYRWMEKASHALAKNASRVHQKIDLQTKFRIVELFIVLKAPSLQKLQTHLLSLFHIRLTTAQIRYAL